MDFRKKATTNVFLFVPLLVGWSRRQVQRGRQNIPPEACGNSPHMSNPFVSSGFFFQRTSLSMSAQNNETAVAAFPLPRPAALPVTRTVTREVRGAGARGAVVLGLCHVPSSSSGFCAFSVP
jgi:hypothetical protein